MTETAARPSNLNLPNVLTTLRIVMVPFFGWVLLHGGGDSSQWRWAAFGIFVAAMITDNVDGAIARARNIETDFGKIADPIADKAMTGMALIGLSVVGDVWWWVTIVILVREWSVTVLRLSVLRHVVIAARASGKLKTTLQAIALSGLLMPLPHSGTLWDTHGGAFDTWGQTWSGFGEVLFYLAQICLAGALLMTLWSGYEFFRDVWRQRHTMRGP